MTNMITGSMLRKAVEHHKTNGGACIEGVARKEDGTTRFLGRDERPNTLETAHWFARCPVCGKEVARGIEYEEAND